MFERETSMEQQWLLAENCAEIGSYEEQMLLYNCPEGLLPLEIIVRAGIRQYRYDISGMHSIEELANKKKLSGEQIRRIFLGIYSTIMQGRRYLLQEESYCIIPESVFFDRNMRLFLCYLPGYKQEITGQLQKLSEWVLEQLDPMDSMAVFRGYGIHVLCKEGKVGLADLQRLFSSEDELTEQKEVSTVDSVDDNKRTCSENALRVEQVKKKRLLPSGVGILFVEGGVVFALFCAIVFLLP